MQDQPLIIVLVIALILNAIIILAAVVWSRRHPDPVMRGARGSGIGDGWTPAHDSFVDGRPPAAAGTVAGFEPAEMAAPAVAEMAGDSALEPDEIGFDLSELADSEPLDGKTGLGRSPAWLRTAELEQSRTIRYARPATVVVFELDGLDRLVLRLGQEAADRIVAAVADTLRRNTRDSDRLARLGPGRFGTVLTETDDVQAINHIERIRSATDLWLESGSISMRLAIGWAQLSANRALDDTVKLALERMNADRRTTRVHGLRERDALRRKTSRRPPAASAIA